MDDRYLFRGLKFDGFKYGCLTVLGENWYVDSLSVNKSTVGQCTGLRDKNGKLIYEGDIVAYADSDKSCTNRLLFVCIFSSGSFLYKVAKGHYKHISRHMVGDLVEYVILGNIHENPELLEV